MADSPRKQIKSWPASRSLGEGWWRERDSNPRYPFRDKHDFQSCAFNRSAISPQIFNYYFLAVVFFLATGFLAATVFFTVVVFAGVAFFIGWGFYDI